MCTSQVSLPTSYFEQVKSTIEVLKTAVAAMKAHMLAYNTNIVLPSARMEMPNGLAQLTTELRRLQGKIQSGECQNRLEAAEAEFAQIGTEQQQMQGETLQRKILSDDCQGGLVTAGANAAEQACQVGVGTLQLGASSDWARPAVAVSPKAMGVKLRLRARLHLEVLRTLEWACRLMGTPP